MSVTPVHPQTRYHEEVLLRPHIDTLRQLLYKLAHVSCDGGRLVELRRVARRRHHMHLGVAQILAEFGSVANVEHGVIGAP